MQINQRNRSLSICPAMDRLLKMGKLSKKVSFRVISCKNSVDQPRKSVRRNIILIYTMDMNQVNFILVYTYHMIQKGRF